MTPKQALSKLRRAREIDANGWRAELKGVRAALSNGTYSGHYARSEKLGDQANALFQEVETYLESLS